MDGTRAGQKSLHAQVHLQEYSGKAKNKGFGMTGKRSFKRAFHRSIRDGFTMYHGRIFTPSDFNLPFTTDKPQVHPHVRTQPQKPYASFNFQLERRLGRLVQLKLRGRTQDLDLTHCYQQVYKPSKSCGTLSQRLEIT